MTAQWDSRRMAETSGSGRSPASPVLSEAKDAPKLSLVESQPIDITALIRREIQQRDWEQVMIQRDRRAPVFLPDRIRRLWR
jgi:hypothetical protein